MPDLSGVLIAIHNYKCFGEEWEGFEFIRPINLIVGKNNTGKSSLLELVQFAIDIGKLLPNLGRDGKDPEVSITMPLSEVDLKKIFREGLSGGPISGDHWKFGKKWVGKSLRWSVNHTNKRHFISIEPPLDTTNTKDYLDKLTEKCSSPFTDLKFKGLRAERDIRPEEAGTSLELSDNGNGLTNLVQAYVNRANFPSDLVENTFLTELNAILKPDVHFIDIVVQQHDNNRWEIFLEEENKGRVSLSNTGSGIKTVILILALLYLVPNFEKIKLDKYIFCFEELENNMHPSLLRRLLLYLRQKALDLGCHFFLTTHSNVAIDLFGSDSKSQTLHVTHNGTFGKIRHVRTYIESKGILDDLDVRASDLLQANGVIWVEGPSDRLYVRRWIEVFSGNEIREGAHYQCVIYGGRLLSHLQASDPDFDMDNLLNIFRVNRNAILIMDSDKKKKHSRK